MNNKQFKAAVENCLIQHGFIKKDSFYYLKNDDVICVIGLQKSNYSGGYYINVGYVISALNSNLIYPADVDGDIRTRFNAVSEGKLVDIFYIQNIDSVCELTVKLNENIELLITNKVSVDGLKHLLNNNPTLLYQTKISAKKYLGFETS